MRVEEVTRKRFFFEKKKQKTSIRWSPVDRPWHKPNGQTFFGSFFQKRTSSFPTLAYWNG
jgi:hypothetical protein